MNEPHLRFNLLLLIALFSSPIISSSKMSLRQTYIVLVDGDAKPSVFPTHAHWYATAFAGNSVIHTYSSIFHGFSARLTSSAAASLSASPAILSLLPEQVRHPTTTRSPQFLGLRSSALLAESHFGSDLVIAVLDTGIWPEHASFSDAGLGPIPATWRGSCVPGIAFPASTCNRKLIGARYFSSGYEASSGPMNATAELRSARDTNGHGTHTASIAAGRHVYPASALGDARGVAAGMAPKARLAAYKVCWASGCFDSDILAAFDSAVADGANVVSLSVGGVTVPYHLDAIAVGSFAAAEAGIFVSASAGNGGPGGLTVTNVAPWMTTVGAGSIDRSFPAHVLLGNGRVLPGVGVCAGLGIPQDPMPPLVYASLCLDGSLNSTAVNGAVVVCDRGVSSRAAKGEAVRRAGGAGMVIANGVFDGEGLVADCHVIPASAVGAAAGGEIRRYAAAGGNPIGTILFRGTQLGVRPAPVVASFSARGPSPQSPEILKPDVVAPGLNILGAWPDGIGPAGVPSDRRRTAFNILSGTSMACPHVSGVAALLKAAHPDWSPAAVRSALMTTAYSRDNQGRLMVDEATGDAAGAFDTGAGHVDPRRAMDPGLIYDIAPADYVSFLCNLNYTSENIKAVTRRAADCREARKAGHAGNLNYPSFSAVFRGADGRMEAAHFLRTVTNVGRGAAVYRAEVVVPEGYHVEVEPAELRFRRKGQRLSYLLRVEEKGGGRFPAGSSAVRGGELVWIDGQHRVRSPIVVTIQDSD